MISLREDDTLNRCLTWWRAYHSSQRKKRKAIEMALSLAKWNVLQSHFLILHAQTLVESQTKERYARAFRQNNLLQSVLLRWGPLRRLDEAERFGQAGSISFSFSKPLLLLPFLRNQTSSSLRPVLCLLRAAPHHPSRQTRSSGMRSRAGGRRTLSPPGPSSQLGTEESRSKPAREMQRLWPSALKSGARLRFGAKSSDQASTPA